MNSNINFQIEDKATQNGKIIGRCLGKITAYLFCIYTAYFGCTIFYKDIPWPIYLLIAMPLFMTKNALVIFVPLWLYWLFGFPPIFK